MSRITYRDLNANQRRFLGWAWTATPRPAAYRKRQRADFDAMIAMGLLETTERFVNGRWATYYTLTEDGRRVYDGRKVYG